MNAISSLSLGDSLYVDGNYEGAIENYTAAICLTDSRRIKETDTSHAQNQNNNVDTKIKETETTVIRFRSLSHRSETYLSLKKFPHAYNDANAALSLYPPSDSLDSLTGLRVAEIALAHVSSNEYLHTRG